MKDYKQKPADRKRSKNRNTKANSERRGGRVYLTGVITGIALTLLFNHRDDLLIYIQGQSESEIARQGTEKRGEDGHTDPTEEELKFEFYTRLPAMEVPVDSGQEEQRDVADHPDHLYVLQVGSFNQRSDAERLKAELALLGEVAHIENVTVNERSMHRVRLGPYRSARKLSAVKNRLSALDVPTMALKLRKEE